MTESFELPDRWAEYANKMETDRLNERRSTWPDQKDKNRTHPQIIIEKNDSIDSRYCLGRPDSGSCSPSSMISDSMSISEFDPSISHMTQSLRPHSRALISGYLYKKGVKSKMWKKRWYTLSDYTLFCYKSSKDAQLLSAIPLPSFSVSIISAEDKIRRKHGFKVFKKHIRTHYFSADSEREMNDWIQEIGLACNLQSGADTASIAESTDLSRSVSYYTGKRQRTEIETKREDSFTRHGSLMLKNSQDDLCDQNQTGNSRVTNNEGWRKTVDRGMSTPLKMKPKFSVGSSPLKSSETNRNFTSEVRKSASSYELRLLNDREGNNHTGSDLRLPMFKYTENELNEKPKEELMRIVLKLVNELSVSNTEKIKYKKRMEKHKSTLVELKTSMVQIFDKMQNQLYVEQEKYSAAMRQVRQLEKQISNLEASSKLGRDIFKLTPQLANEIEALEEKISKAQEAMSDVKSAAYHGTFKEVITISSNLEAKEQYDIHLSQLRDLIQELNTKKTTIQNKKEEVITRMKETSENIKSLYNEKMKVEREIESLKSLDDDESMKENAQENHEKELMDIIGNVHKEEQKFDELAEEDQLQNSRILQIDRQVKRAEQLERDVVYVEESEKSTLKDKIQRNIALLKTHLLDIAEDRSKHEQEFYMISSRSPNGMFPKLPHLSQPHSDILKELANATRYLEYKSILELGLFSRMLQELLELESDNIDKLKVLVIESRKLQTNYSVDIPQKSAIISILNPATSRLARQILSTRNFQAMLVV